MHLQATHWSRKGFIVVLFCLGCVIQAVAQQPGPLYDPKEPLFASSGNSIKDTASINSEKTTSFRGIGSMLTKYGKANQLYYVMIDSLSKVLFRHPLEDSGGLKYASEWVGTPNMGLRRPNYVIIHHTANNSCDETLQEFTSTAGREASAHYIICKDGTIHHMMNDLLRSHHAGDSKWGNNTDLNSSSIGIELVNNGYQPFSDEQINSLSLLLERLKTTYKIPNANFIGHADIAPARKADPSSKFPWKQLSEKGFGLWWDDTTNMQVPDNFDYLMGLRIIGYDISNPDAAVTAFKRHFMADNSWVMNNAVRKIIYAMYRKFE